MQRLLNWLAGLPAPMACALCVLVGAVWMMPRFARTDSVLGISFQMFTTTGLADAGQYMALVEWFRGGPLTTIWPFAMRPMTPWLASLMPLDPLWGLAVVGLIGGMIGVSAMFAICRELGADVRAATLATLTFALSFPMFYYTTIGLVDALSIGLSTVAVWLTLRGRYVLAALVLAVAVFNKETALVALGFIVPWIILHGAGTGRFAYALLAVVAAVGVHLAAHTLLAPKLPATGSWELWNWAGVVTNLYRPRFYATQALAIGIQGVVVIAWWLRSFAWRLDYVLDPWKLGYGAAVALMIYSLQHGEEIGGSDGRFLWYGQVFTTALLAKLISQWLADRRQPGTIAT